jgi:hypothetical protein
MTWEMFANGRWGMLGALLAAHALPALLLTALQIDGALEADDESSVIIHMMTSLMAGMTFAAAIMSAQGSPARLYAYPVSTASLVAWQMIPAMATLFAESVFSASLLNAIYKLNWPIWGPALFMACSLATVYAVLWLTSKSAWLLPAVTIVGGALGWWYVHRYRPVLSGPAHLWQDLTVTEVLTMLGVSVTAYVTGVYAINRDRCGEALRSESLRLWFDRVLDPAPALGQPFATPQAAQFWFEWRQKGAMPWLVAFMLMIVFCGWVMFSRKPESLQEGSVVLGIFLPIMGFIMGLVIGLTGPQDGKLEMGQFLATRPMTNTDYAWMILKTTGLNVVGGWLVWCFAAGGVSLVLWCLDLHSGRILPPEMQWWHVPLILLATWLTTALVSCLVLCGRPRFLVGLICTFFGLIILGIMFGKWGLSETERLRFHQGIYILSAIAFAGLTTWAFAAAWRHQLIGKLTITLAAGMWTVAAVSVVVDSFVNHRESLHWSILAVGVAALAVAPFATTPLSLAWNRHR